MNKEQLLEEAKKRYPIGTNVISLASFGYTGKIIHKDNLRYREEIWFETIDGLYNLQVYCKGKWAKIVSYPENYKPTSKLFPIY